ncbi:FAD-dependent oxidoreductase [Cellulomonas sp. ATA003]|uniref:NAD(P)/FAD-dependent oxidoreductase n=1 Tax=Cellulomonas sp. ATA003 TaxID=3073064 RepID=UPI0037C136CA
MGRPGWQRGHRTRWSRTGGGVVRSAGRVHVAVVGGGILGVSTAANLARRGAHVTLVTDGPLAGGASGRSLSWLNSFGRRSDAYHRLRRAGLARYRDLTRTTDCAGWLRFDGGLAWAAPDDAAEQRDVVDHLRRIGYAVERLTPDEVRERVPGVDARAVPDDGAVLAPDEGWVDLPSLVEHLVTQLVADGGTVVTDARPCRPLLDGDRVSGVRTAAGRRSAGTPSCSRRAPPCRAPSSRSGCGCRTRRPRPCSSGPRRWRRGCGLSSTPRGSRSGRHPAVVSWSTPAGRSARSSGGRTGRTGSGRRRWTGCSARRPPCSPATPPCGPSATAPGPSPSPVTASPSSERCPACGVCTSRSPTAVRPSGSSRATCWRRRCSPAGGTRCWPGSVRSASPDRTTAAAAPVRRPPWVRRP